MTAIYRFGRFELKPATRQLLVDHKPEQLGARAFDLLLALVERRDRLVTKNELLDLVWPGLVVEENNLMVQVSALRKILGQEAIATIPGRGYRFAAAVADSEADGSSPPPAPVQTNPASAERPVDGSGARAKGWQRFAAGALAMALAAIAVWQFPRLQATSAAPPPAFSVAVMPFVAAGGTAGEEQFAHALAEDLLTAMGKSKFLKLTSGRKVLDYKDKRIDTRSIGHELNVRYLIDGEVRSTGSEMTITAHLVEAESGANVWSDQLKAGAASSAEASGDPARKLGLLLRAAVYEREVHRAVANPVPDSAVDLFLQGVAANRAASTLEERIAARKYYDAALRIDPDFVSALFYLSNYLDDLLLNDLDSDRATRAQRIDEQDRITYRMVGIDDAGSSIWYQRAQALVWLGRWDQALTANTKSRSLFESPDAASLAQQAWIMLTMDRPEDALAIALHATSIVPVNGTGQEGFSIRMVCESLLLLGRYEEAVVACEKSAARDDWWLDHVWLAAGYAQLGDLSRSAAAVAALLKKKPGFTLEKFKPINVGNPGFQQRTETHLYAGLRKAGIPER